jgi:hypothetical protein
MPLLVLPKAIAIGDIIAYANFKMMTPEGRRNRYTFAGAEYFKRMQKLDLYTIDTEEIARRISKWNLSGVFEEKLV